MYTLDTLYSAPCAMLYSTRIWIYDLEYGVSVGFFMNTENGMWTIYCITITRFCTCNSFKIASVLDYLCPVGGTCNPLLWFKTA